MTAISRLGAEGYGVRRTGSFSGKTPGTAGGPHPVGVITRLSLDGYGARRYSSFAGKTQTAPHPAVGHSGTGTRYRYSTSYNRDKQKWESLLEEIRDDEAVPTKAKTAVAAVKKAKARALEVVESRDLEAEQVERLAQLYEAARSARKAAEAIAAADEAVRFAKILMDEEDEDEIMILLGMLH